MIQGVKLKQRREALTLTQQKLADRLCVTTVQEVSQWENNRTQPDSDCILLLAKLLKTTADVLWMRRRPEPCPGSSPIRCFQRSTFTPS